MHAARLSRRYVVRWNDYETSVDVGPLRPSSPSTTPTEK
jgi:hypothetical protein